MLPICLKHVPDTSRFFLQEKFEWIDGDHFCSTITKTHVTLSCEMELSLNGGLWEIIYVILTWYHQYHINVETASNINNSSDPAENLRTLLSCNWIHKEQFHKILCRLNLKHKEDYSELCYMMESIYNSVLPKYLDFSDYKRIEQDGKAKRRI